MSSDRRNLVKRGSVWYVKRMVRGRMVVRTTGETNLARARERRDEILAEMKDDALGRMNTTYTVGEWWAHYEKTYTPNKLAPHRDEQCIRQFLAHHRHREMRAFKKSDCVGWLNRRRTAEYAPSTINRERQFLQGFFQRAVEDEVLSKNPWRGIPKEAWEPRIRVLTPDEEAKLRTVMTPRLQRWLTFMLGTGLRIKEACAITPEHIDFEKHTLTVPAEAAMGHSSVEITRRNYVHESDDALVDAVRKVNVLAAPPAA